MGNCTCHACAMLRGDGQFDPTVICCVGRSRTDHHLDFIALLNRAGVILVVAASLWVAMILINVML